MNPDLNVNKQTKQYIPMATFSVFSRARLIKAKTGVLTEFSFLETKSLSNSAGLLGLVTHSRLHTHFNNYQVYVPTVRVLTNHSLI